MSIDVVHASCAGLDVHARSVVVATITPAGRQVRTVTTMTADLEALAAWLVEQGITHVALESTGVYWKPVYNVLEQFPLTLLVVNAQHLKKVEGRKTDVKDAEWLADLLRLGLLTPSFIPDRATRELRELTRYRRALIQERSREANRIHKLLEGANLKLGAVATDILGVSGRAILTALAAGQSDPAALADLAQGRLRAKRAALVAALHGTLSADLRLVLGGLLAHVACLDQQIAELSAAIRERLTPQADALRRLDTIPGVGEQTAEVILTELGPDMRRFASAGHAASWAGLCPGHNESGGRRRSGRTRKGNGYLRTALVEAARAAARTKHTYLAAQYRRLAARRGPKRAALAVAHSILRIAYYLLRDGTTYVDLGANYFDERQRTRTIHRAVRRIQALGYTVTLTAVAS
jgi:transposase